MPSWTRQLGLTEGIGLGRCSLQWASVLALGFLGVERRRALTLFCAWHARLGLRARSSLPCQGVLSGQKRVPSLLFGLPPCLFLCQAPPRSGAQRNEERIMSLSAVRTTLPDAWQSPHLCPQAQRARRAHVLAAADMEPGSVSCWPPGVREASAEALSRPRCRSFRSLPSTDLCARLARHGRAGRPTPSNLAMLNGANTPESLFLFWRRAQLTRP